MQTFISSSSTMTKLVKYEEFLALPNFFYLTLGIEPYDKDPKAEVTKKRSHFWANLIFFGGLLNMNFVLLGEILFVMRAFKNGNNFLQATTCLSYVGFVSVGDFKMLSVWWKKRELTTFVHKMDEIFPKSAESQEKYKLRGYLRQCMIVTISFSLLYMLLIWTYNLFAALQYLIYERWLEIRVVGKELPYYMYLPWDWHDNWTYYVLYASSNLAGYTSAAGQISADLVLCAMATQLVMHFDYLSRRIEEYKVKAGSLNAVEDAAGRKEDMDFLRDAIAFHVKILNLSEMMNDVFGVPLLFNFLTSSGVICFVGFQATIGVAPDLMFKSLVGVVSTSTQVYLICHYGQMLIDSSTNIADAVYNQNWSNADVRYQKMLVLMAERAQKPVVLQATSFLKISRRTMTEIMQMSYKFLALLRTMYAE